jgi:hypothetical protein
VLGENTQLPPTLDSKMGEIRGEIMDARVVEGRVRGDTSRSNTTSKEARMSKTQLGEILKAQSGCYTGSGFPSYVLNITHYLYTIYNLLYTIYYILSTIYYLPYNIY